MSERFGTAIRGGGSGPAAWLPIVPGLPVGREAQHSNAGAFRIGAHGGSASMFSRGLNWPGAG